MLRPEERIRTRAQLKEWLQAELKPYRLRWHSFTSIYEADVLRRHVILLRKAEYHLNAGHRLAAVWYKLRLNRLQTRHSLHIPLNVCGKGFRLMHLGPVLINGKAALGPNCTLHINTSIVAGGTDDGVPTLGSGVVVGVGAVILGGVHIADNVAIGANAVVNRDVTEDNVTVAGVPARKISDHGRLDWNRQH